MNRVRTATKWIIICTTAALLAWDLVVVLVYGHPGRTTISEMILDWSGQYPAIPFAAGVLCGHLFFPIPRAKK